VLWLIARVARIPAHERPLFILLVAQGGEFAFVLLGVGAARGAIDTPMAQALTLAVALSMLLTPLVLALHDRVLMPRLTSGESKPPPDKPEAAQVIVAGLGRVGQVVARLLNAADIHPTVLDDDPDNVEQSRKFGFRVFYGDATRLDLLHAAGADSAGYLIIAIEDAAAITQLARVARANFPNLRIIARARDMRHSFELRDLGVEFIERETWLSALKLGETALALIGADPERAKRVAEAFAAHDEEVQAKLYQVHKSSPDAHLTVSNELRDQLARTLSEDERSNISGR
jgi:glutathione-regulated potassium-efflux system ancillary protein KefC